MWRYRIGHQLEAVTHKVGAVSRSAAHLGFEVFRIATITELPSVYEKRPAVPPPVKVLCCSPRPFKK